MLHCLTVGYTFVYTALLRITATWASPLTGGPPVRWFVIFKPSSRSGVTRFGRAQRWRPRARSVAGKSPPGGSLAAANRALFFMKRQDMRIYICVYLMCNHEYIQQKLHVPKQVQHLDCIVRLYVPGWSKIEHPLQHAFRRTHTGACRTLHPERSRRWAVYRIFSQQGLDWVPVWTTPVAEGRRSHTRWLVTVPKMGQHAK